MIGRLRGKLWSTQAPWVVVDVQGVGYELQASMTTCSQLPALGEPVELFTQLIVREDAFLLYGFFSEDEKELFQLLLKVNGIGPKMGIGILSSMDVAGFIRCVQLQDAQSLTSIPGVGRKTAERILMEMRDRLAQFSPRAASALPGVKLARGFPQVQQEAIQALLALGYKPKEASAAVVGVAEEGLPVAEVIRRALQSLGRV